MFHFHISADSKTLEINLMRNLGSKAMELHIKNTVGTSFNFIITNNIPGNPKFQEVPEFEIFEVFAEPKSSFLAQSEC